MFFFANYLLAFNQKYCIKFNKINLSFDLQRVINKIKTFKQIFQKFEDRVSFYLANDLLNILDNK